MILAMSFVLEKLLSDFDQKRHSIFYLRLAVLTILYKLMSSKMSYVDLKEKNFELLNQVINLGIENTPFWF